MAALQNLYHKRLVAETSSKACLICYKPTPTVLITPDSRDFFYVCPGHLTDRGFATPSDGTGGSDNETEKKKRDEELQREIEIVKKEYEDKMKKRKKGKKKEEKDANGKKIKDDDDDFGDDEKKEESEKDAKIKSLEGQKSAAQDAGSGPRVFMLHKNIFQMRTNRLREAQLAKKRQEQLKSGSLFPSVPKGSLS